MELTFLASSYAPNATAIPAALTGFAVWVLAAAVLLRQRDSRVALLFALMIFLVGVWCFCFVGMYCATEAETADRWGRAGLAAVALLPPAVYEFTVTALRLHDRRRTWIHVAWAGAMLFAYLIVGTNLVIAGVKHFTWGFYPQFGRLGPLYLIAFFLVLGVHLVDYWREYRSTSDPLRRRRIRDLLIAFVIVYLSAVDYLPMFGLDLFPFGFVAVLAFLVFAGQAIRHHRLIRITPSTAAREILDTMADALFVIDHERRIRVMNAAVQTLLGYSELDLAGKPINSLQPAGSPSTSLEAILEKGTVRDQECVFRAKDRQLIDVSISASPLRSQIEDAPGGHVVIARDIRERKRSEAELHEFNLRLQQSNRELEEFAHVASHDLQEPLRKIQAFGDRLQKRYGETLGDDGKDYLARMLNASQRMQILITDVLAFARVTTKAQPFRPVDLKKIADEVAGDLEMRIQRSRAHVDIGELPIIEADALQMRQLLQNLLGNALKFHKSDVPPVVSIQARAPEDGFVIIEVADNGIGFDERHLEKIFTIFQRLHGRGEYEGTGIGLAICRKIAERHGGTITARSAPGAGATFSVRLPISHTEGSDVPDERRGQTNHDSDG